VTVQVLVAKGPAQDVVWDEAKVRVKAEWVDRLPQGRAEVVSVRTVEQQLLMLQGSLVMRKAVLSVEQE
jgi:hypothetical protein